MSTRRRKTEQVLEDLREIELTGWEGQCKKDIQRDDAAAWKASGTAASGKETTPNLGSRSLIFSAIFGKFIQLLRVFFFHFTRLGYEGTGYASSSDLKAPAVPLART